jgi:hypothetical protein
MMFCQLQDTIHQAKRVEDVCKAITKTTIIKHHLQKKKKILSSRSSNIFFQRKVRNISMLLQDIKEKTLLKIDATRSRWRYEKLAVISSVAAI